MQNGIAQVLNQLLNSNRSISSTADSLATKIYERDSKLGGSIAGVISDMTRTISDYSSTFTNSLPSTSGLVVDVAGLEKQLTDAQSHIVDAQSASMSKAIEKKMADIEQYVKLVQLAGDEVLTRGKSILNSLSNLPDIDYTSMNLDTQKLLSEAIDGSKLLEKASAAIQAQSAMTVNVLSQKVGELVQAVQAQTSASTQRDAQLKSVQTQFEGRQSTMDSLKSSLTDRVGSAVEGAQNMLNVTGGAIEDLQQQSEGKMAELARSLADQSADLEHHVSESAPEFLANYESEKVSSMMNRINEINATVNSIQQEARNQFDISGLSLGSFLDREIANQPSQNIVKLLQHLSKDNEAEHRLQDETWAVVKRVNASIRAHNSSLKQPLIPVDVNAESADFISALDRVLNETTKFQESQHSETQKILRESERFDNQDDEMVERNVSGIQNFTKQANGILDSINATERLELGPGIKSVSEKVSNLRKVVESVSNLSSWTVRPNLEDVRAELQQPLVAVTVRKPESNQLLNDAKNFIKSQLVNETEVLLDQRIAAQSESFEHTIDSLTDLTQQLKTLTESEDKLENEFRLKILEKFQKRNEKYETEFANEFRVIKDELDKTVSQFPSKSDMQNELHTLIRGLRRRNRPSTTVK